MSARGPRQVVPVAALHKGYIEAFARIVERIEAAVRASERPLALPIAMYVAGGAAQLFYTGARVSMDIDATFSQRLLLPEDLDVAYVDGDGIARTLYFDRQYNESFALLHEDVHEDARPLRIEGLDPGVVDVRVFAPVDLAVSKLSRYAEHDQADIAALARAGLITAEAVRRRAEEAMGGYVGEVQRVRTSIDLACDLIKKNRA